MRLIFSVIILSLCSGYFALNPRAISDLNVMKSATSSVGKQSQTKTACVITPTDGKDSILVQRLEESIKAVTGLSNIYSWTTDNELKWWTVDLTSSQLSELRRNIDVDFAGESHFTKDFRAVPDELASSSDPFLASTIVEREAGQVYDWQVAAGGDLISISSPKGDEGSCLPGFVYPIEAGRTTYIYQLEFGIIPGYEEEFAPDRLKKPLETNIHRHLKSSALKPTKHSTCVASKAIGVEYGAGKNANLVPVLVGNRELTSVVEGLKVALDDIRDKNRAGKSLVLMSIGSELPLELLKMLKSPAVREQEEHLNQLFDLGVPVIVAADNEVSGGGTLPSGLATLGFPLIVVGNAFRDGRIWPGSQGGDIVTLFACGTYVRCVCDRAKSGTSYATPLVAGTIAVFMSQKVGAFFEATNGLTGRAFVIAVRNFMRDRANWRRTGGSNMLWNLVTQEDQDDIWDF